MRLRGVSPLIAELAIVVAIVATVVFYARFSGDVIASHKPTYGVVGVRADYEYLGDLGYIDTYDYNARYAYKLYIVITNMGDKPVEVNNVSLADATGGDCQVCASSDCPVYQLILQNYTRVIPPHSSAVTSALVLSQERLDGSSTCVVLRVVIYRGHSYIEIHLDPFHRGEGNGA